MAENVITVQHVNKTFGTVRAVKDLSFQVRADTCFGILGPNGAGKTTMMKILYGRCTRDTDSSGRMDIFGHDPAADELSIKYLSGVVPQENNLDEELNVIQNLMIYARFYRIPPAEATQRIDYLLRFLELSEKTKAKIRELSGGMKRRLVIARALMNNPRLLILDEPTTGLDPQVRHLIWDKLRQLKKQGTTIILTTHYMDEAFQICDVVLIMHKGEKVLQDNPRNLLKQNTEEYVLELFDPDSVTSLSGHNLLEHVRMDKSQEIARLYSDNVEHLKTLAASLEGGHFFLRQANLEDVFLRATGRALNEKQ